MSLSTGCVLDVDASAIESGVSHDRNHHTLTPTATTTIRGKAGKGTFFNGTTSFVDCGNDSSLNNHEAFTIEAWYKTTVTDTGTLVGKMPSTGAAYGYRLQYFLPTSNFDFVLWENSVASEVSTSSIGFLDGNWHHIVGVRTTSTHLKIYLDGLEKNSADITARNISTTASLWIGADDWTGGPTQAFDGLISSIKIYNYALSATQIKRNYLSKAYLYTPHPVIIP